MKKILGLDLGTTSIGWTFVNEKENDDEQSSIVNLGVRVNPLTVDEQTNFEKGKPISINADRTLKRSARRNLQRYKLRRENLIQILKDNGLIDDNTILAEDGKNTTHSLYALRSKAANEQVSKVEFARILLMINKKRGYKSSRKAKNEEEGQAIDGMETAKRLYEENQTPGQLCYQLLKARKKTLPDFYRSDLKAELEKVWNFQKQFYPEILTDIFQKEIEGKGQRATSAAFWNIYKFNTAENKGTRDEKKLQAYKWRSEAVYKQLEKEEVAFVITEINSNINHSSGYLGAIGDRSKELYFNKETVGQYCYRQLKENRHTNLRNQVFYRQDYLDEFEQIWETQAKFHKELTPELKKEIRDVIIFYQRKLKSQKSLIGFCEFENRTIEIEKNGKKIEKKIGYKVAPKSSPLFQEFKIWQVLHNIEFRNKITKEKKVPDLDEKNILFEELNLKGNLDAAKVTEILFEKSKEWEMNYKTIEGNRTNKALYDAYLKMIETEGLYDVRELLHVKWDKDEIDLAEIPVAAREIKNMIRSIFETIGIDTQILDFNAESDGKAFEDQPSYQLWHLLYSYEGDNSTSGNELLYELLNKKFGFTKEYAQILGNIILPDDYGSLSTKAMRKIYPFIKENNYSDACVYAGYRHSASSLTKEEIENKPLKDRLKNLPKNSLRNPVVEKILNQMVNVINAIIDDPKMGRPDEIRIELARELKKTAKEREEMTASINKAKGDHEKIRLLLISDFGIKNPTRNDIIRYKLYEELKPNGYHTLYSNTYIPREKLFSKEFDIEHIIPKALSFDDSFSNKTICSREENLKKRDRTAFDFICGDYNSNLEDYKNRIEMMFKLKEGSISKAKYKKLLMQASEIGDGFIERDLRDTQYIARKAREMLLEISRSVVSTTGSITDRLREDWGLINIMQELNFDKYKQLGMTEMVEKKDGSLKERIVDWSKRNDHRHHAMDALTVAFTKHSHIQYLNYLNARRDETHKYHGNIIAIEQKELESVIDSEGNKKRQFKQPIPNFRQVAKQQLENILISHKGKNKVVTKNINRYKTTQGEQKKVELTPRGQLHKETVYGKLEQYVTKEEKIGAKFDLEMIQKVASPKIKEALIKRLTEYNGDPKKAFTGKNSLDKNPIYLNEAKSLKVPEKVKLGFLKPDYTIRKEISPDLKVEKIIDKGIRDILQKRLAEFDGNTKEAFSNLDKNPIWLNKENGISIKRITISGVSNAEALHYKKNHLGELLLDEKGNKMPVDFVSTGNNHHVAIYLDQDGNLQESVVSFYEAVARINEGLSVIDKVYNQHLGWEFLFTMKQNEYFVFPSADFDPAEINLLDPDNRKLISPNLFRVQKIATKNYFFRHHLETDVQERALLKGITYKPQLGLSGIIGIIKVRINHIGQIIQVGE